MQTNIIAFYKLNNCLSRSLIVRHANDKQKTYKKIAFQMNKIFLQARHVKTKINKKKSTFFADLERNHLAESGDSVGEL